MARDIRIDQVAALFSEGVSPDAPTRGELRRRRDEVLRESPKERLVRLFGALRHGLSPQRLSETWAAVDLVLRDRSICPLDLPDPEQPLSKPDGLCGITADLSPEAIIDAYTRGLHLGGSVGRPTWWSPSQRYVLSPGETHISGKVRGLLLRRDARVTFDRSPYEVIAACARPEPHAGANYRGEERRASRRGFSPERARSYANLFDTGVAHSVEVRGATGTLEAGIVGLSLGRVFVIETLFGAADMVDLALVVLHRHLAAWGYELIDAKQLKGLARLGFAPVPRAEFRARTIGLFHGGRRGRWQVDRAHCGVEPAQVPASDAAKVQGSKPGLKLAA